MNRGYVYRDRVRPEHAGLTVLAYHVARHRHSGRDRWHDHVEAGRVRVNGRVARCQDVLRQGDALEFHRPPWVEPDAPMGFRVVHEDADVLAVDKPSGLQVLPAGRFLENTLLRAVRRGLAERREWSPVHRLGRGTSGIVLFGKTTSSRASLSRQFREGSASKLYLGVVQGLPGPDSFVATQPIGPVADGGGHAHAATAVGRRSVTRVRVVRRDAGRGTSLVAASPLTGRPDQIRIHLAACGWPLVGDPLYGAGCELKPGARPGDVGYLLHAVALRVVHPATGEWLRLRCEAPWRLDGS